jgi:cellulose synthase/poly-beta-1,6-N-acetylglucosamine synthase-like glycosyltransferase
MMVTKDACEAIGGYEKIPYSLTEDIGLLTAIKRVGFSATNALNRESMATIEGLPDWQTLIAQRARWTYGVFRIHPMMVVLLGIRSLFLIMLLLIIWSKPWLAIGLFLLKLSINGVFLSKVAKALGQGINLWHFMCFEVYCFLIALSGSLSYLFSSKIHWKERAFG